MVISNGFEIGYLLVAFALPGILLIGGLLDTLYLENLHPRLVGATLVIPTPNRAGERS